MTVRPSAETLRAAIRALGQHFDAQALAATRALYRDSIDPTPAAREWREIVYGEHPRHRLDLYAPAASPRAVVVFVHGGGFVAGDKNGDGIYYVNLGRWFARQGFAAVLANYRLAPEHAWPAGARDLSRLLERLDAVLEACDAARAPRFVMGQSAGASHVASWLFDEAARGRTDRHAAAGVLLMSGYYHAKAPLPAGPLAYFGEDPALHAARSPLHHVRDTGVPLWLSLAELDPPWIAAQTYELAAALTAASPKGPQFHWYAGHNHVSTVQSLGSVQTDAGGPILQFIEDVLAR